MPLVNINKVKGLNNSKKHAEISCLKDDLLDTLELPDCHTYMTDLDVPVINLKMKDEVMYLFKDLERYLNKFF